MIKNKSKESDLNADIDIVCKPQPKENHHSKRVTKIREYTSRKDRTSEQIMMKIPNTNMNLKTELPQNKNNGVRERNNYNCFSEKSKFNSHRNSIYCNDNKITQERVIDSVQTDKFYQDLSIKSRNMQN